MATTPLPVIVVMGVSGCGKSTVGVLLSQRLAGSFRDGDDLHPESNITKMKSSQPLNDQDRLPWLQSINGLLKT
jgi:gluconokinase